MSEVVEIPLSKNIFQKNGNFLEFGIISTLLLLILICSTIWYSHFRWSRRRLYELCAKFPQLEHNLAFVGITLKLTDSEKWLKFMTDTCLTGTPKLVWMAHMPQILCHRPEDLEIILNSSKTLSKYRQFYKFVEPVVGNGLFSAPVHTWKVHRKALMPTFNQKVLNSFFDVFVKQSDILLKLLKTDTGNFFDVTRRINHWSLDTICETVLGVNIHAQTKDSLFVSSIQNLMETAFARIFNIIYHNKFIYENIIPVGRRDMKRANFIKEFVDNVLEEKYRIDKRNNQEKINRPEAEIEDEKQIITTLEMLMDLNKNKINNFTDEDLRNETTTIMVAKALYEEVVDVLGLNRPITVTDLSQFKYLERVIKETMRVFPLGPFVYREIDEDLDIKNYTLPKGAAVGIAVMALHRSPEYWPNPLKFDPDRFLPEEVAKRHPYAYLPFLAGPRNCIGLKYAMMTMKTVVALIVRKFHIETSYQTIEEITLKQDIVLRPVHGFPVKITERDAE